MPRSPSQVGGRRSSRRKPNFSCSVPIRHSDAGLQPASRYSTSSRRSLIGLSLALLGPDTGSALGTITKMRMLTRALPSGVLLAALLCSGAVMAGAGRLERGHGPEPSTLDAHRCPEVACANILRDLYEGLVAEDGAGRLIPGMAEGWEVSADGRTWTFRLREGLRWSNGEPLDAGQIVASFRRALEPATAAPYAHHFEAVGDIAAPDPRTVVFRLERSLDLPRLLLLPIAYPVYLPALEQYGARHTRPGRLVGNGAYRLKDWLPQAHVQLERNPYFREPAPIAEVRFHVTEDAASELRRFEA